MQQDQAFRATDGQLFETMEECAQHEVSLTWRQQIAEFLECPAFPYRKGAPQAMAYKIIILWERFKAR